MSPIRRCYGELRVWAGSRRYDLFRPVVAVVVSVFVPSLVMLVDTARYAMNRVLLGFVAVLVIADGFYVCVSGR